MRLTVEINFDNKRIGFGTLSEYLGRLTHYLYKMRGDVIDQPHAGVLQNHEGEVIGKWSIQNDSDSV